ncbi:hypothetical protein NO559_12885 [Dasania sp. GY-MA-18]|uniref:Type IV pilin accessory protein n=1 Tax=Dasania phycosphaerae TaxID=2950436 RepID=A0A9J6RP50_9GAMM|nr:MULTISPECIES: TfpX/TfpZ family type IV pilin accessory protein [Dasania]MCR8923672.1 hypothetical protein [Dasania sp. GY-MA-18]MCZ0866106.1 hypothetical protein [Dasania phycosphaerae]MCZ0869830.1 hypothetical protein [Dasania phycosphaerae]
MMLTVLSAKNRLHASLIHLVYCAVIAFIVVLVVFGVWYPGELAAAAGVTDIFLLLLLVDICLGPLLTLVVFNKAKQELARDLLIIFLFQLTALVGGIYTVFIARPVYVVFAVDRFELVYANDLTREDLLQATYREYQSVPLWGPKWIAAMAPDSAQERQDMLFKALGEGRDLAQTPQYYQPYETAKPRIREKIYPLARLKEFNSQADPMLIELLSRYSLEPSFYGFIPLESEVLDLVVVINNQTAEVEEVVKLKPWHY